MTGNPILNLILAVLLGYVIWRLSLSMIRMMSTSEEEVNPEDIQPVDQDYKCTVCGAELTLKARNRRDEAVPRHCREDMIPVWRPG